MQQGARQIAFLINKSLDEMDIPSNPRERAIILSKMLDITKQQAWSLLDGALPDDPLILQKLSSELEIDLESKDIS